MAPARPARSGPCTLIDDLEEGAEVGLQVYGANTTEDPANRDASCRDIETVYPVRPIDKPAFHAAVDEARPGGFTPIGNALRAAAEELPEDQERAVVLISDGEDTCAPPDPCEVAAELAEQGIGLVVHTVGLAADDATRTQLSCIAETTGGGYVEVENARELEDALPTIVERARRGYTAQGIPIEGTPAPEGAPRLPPGQHVDHLNLNDVAYYALDIPTGATLHASAALIVPPTSASNATTASACTPTSSA